MQLRLRRMHVLSQFNKQNFFNVYNFTTSFEFLNLDIKQQFSFRMESIINFLTKCFNQIVVWVKIKMATRPEHISPPEIVS